MPAHAPRTGIGRWWIPVTVVLAAAALILTILVVNSGSDDDGATASPEGGGTQSAESEGSGSQARDAASEVQGPEQGAFTEAETRDEDDVQAIGPVDAPVALVVFSDYQCPYCAEWSQETLPTMMEYVEDGDMRIEWRDVNVFGDASEQAAKAAHAAALQDAYWEYHDALFADGEHRPESGLTADALTDLADDLGLDTDRFREDMDSQETQETVEAYAQTGLDLGAFSTPTFLVGGEPIVGAQPTDVFVDAVDTALTAQG
ncbi:DsbA family protein [Brevibacterium yomogidense]|uniref:DsbA family protein n=1 Tax=Brevibacterium yomogidense TaxID=946573 RepID=UPI0018DFE8E1|nr:thioredoxin domain-containing protein [Brevibacterium yomogidense]